MNYKRAWVTLKAESGYRVTRNFGGYEDVTLKELMNNMEKRASSEKIGYVLWIKISLIKHWCKLQIKRLVVAIVMEKNYKKTKLTLERQE
jgi:hypothetical protein